uniref:KIND domain-containing protein n=1 Tax=Cyprinodon variegatus TaxID=28743 RepID=A0A3Q2DRB0_CYPVA
MGTFVTLTEVLEARGSPLEEEEVWCLLLATTDLYRKRVSLCLGPGNMCSVLSPGAVLLSANGSLAFKSCSRSEDVISFTAPEVQHESVCVSDPQVVVYSLGMTLYWCADYRLPQNQPVQISAELEGLLLSMCEDMAVRRSDLLTVLETCEFHHKTSALPSPELVLMRVGWSYPIPSLLGTMAAIFAVISG